MNIDLRDLQIFKALLSSNYEIEIYTRNNEVWLIYMPNNEIVGKYNGVTYAPVMTHQAEHLVSLSGIFEKFGVKIKK